jgi:hypothetical protein
MILEILFLYNGLLSNSTNGIGILILHNSCSRSKELIDFSGYFGSIFVTLVVG